MSISLRQSTFDQLIRWGASVGIAVLLLRRLLFNRYPGFLPTRIWHPTSSAAKWTGLAVDAATVFTLLIVLLGLPFCLYFAIRLRDRLHHAQALVIDALCVAALYGTAFVFLRAGGPG